MSYQGVNQYNYKNRLPFGMNTASAAINMINPDNQANPAMGAQIDTQAVVDVASDNFIGNRIKEYGEVDKNKQLAVTFPILLAINAGMDKYMKLYDGPYEKSLAGKIGNFGDKVSEFLFEKNPVGRFLVNVKNKVAPWAKTNIYDRSALLKAFNETPSKPEFELAVQQMDLFKDFALKEYVNGVEEFIKPLENVKDFTSIGADKQTIQHIENLIANAATPEAKSRIFFEEQYKLLKPGATAQELQNFANAANKTELITNLKLKRLNFRDMADFEAIRTSPIKNINRILENLEKTDSKLFARIWWSDKNIASKIGGFLYGRDVPFQRIKNMIKTVAGKDFSPHKSVLGRGLNKAVSYITEGATGRMFNGKLSTFMQAYFVAEALLMATKQDKMSDKTKSFIERMTELVGFLVFMPPAMKLMHRIGGLKNAGMTPEQVKIYEDALKEFNQKVANNIYKGNKKAYKFGERRLKVLGRPKTRNPFVWLGRKIGDFVAVGLDATTKRPYSRFSQKEVNLSLFDLLMKNPFSGKAWSDFIKGIPHRIKDIICSPKYWFKRTSGWVVRFGIAMGLVSFFNKLAIKAIHTVIGKPKYSLLDEEKFTKEQEQQAQAQQAAAIIEQQQRMQQPLNPNNLDDSNLIKQAANGQRPQNQWEQPTQNAQNDTNKGTSESKTVTTTTTENADENNKQLEPKRTYIPSPAGMVPKSPDMSALDEAFAMADAAEAEVQNVLARKY